MTPVPRILRLAQHLTMAVGCIWGAAVSPAQTPSAPVAAAIPIPDSLPKRPFRRLTEGPITLNPGAGQDRFNYVDMYDSPLAAPEVHHIRFMNEHVRFVEVAYFPGVRGRMHGHAYSSVFAIDSPVPKAVNLPLDPDHPNLMGRGAGPGQEFPRCQTMGPQAPHAETNLDSWPHHFYRLEFLRVDGDGLAQHWQQWYPRLTGPAQPPSRLLYEDAHVRLVEVAIRPGQIARMAGSSYPAVLAFDSGGPTPPAGSPPPGLAWPRCSTESPRQAPLAARRNEFPVHYYRIEFKRIDGEAVRTRWAEWYPWMADYKQAYDAAPYSLNY